MDYPSVFVKKNISIVSVLDLQEITKKTVSSQRVAEVLSCAIDGFAKVETKKLEQTHASVVLLEKLLLQRVYGRRVLNHFYQTRVRTNRYDLVGSQKQLELLDLKDCIKLANHLHCKVLLASVIANLHDVVL